MNLPLQSLVEREIQAGPSGEVGRFYWEGFVNRSSGFFTVGRWIVSRHFPEEASSENVSF
jgi:hypothetical protein